jgi:hypothetical protein
MPCYDPTNYEAEAANKKVQQLTRLLCAACAAMSEGQMSPGVLRWWKAHRKFDERRKKKAVRK